MHKNQDFKHLLDRITAREEKMDSLTKEVGKLRRFIANPDNAKDSEDEFIIHCLQAHDALIQLIKTSQQNQDVKKLFLAMEGKGTKNEHDTTQELSAGSHNKNGKILIRRKEEGPSCGSNGERQRRSDCGNRAAFTLEEYWNKNPSVVSPRASSCSK
jgi:hypothetical protein